MAKEFRRFIAWDGEGISDDQGPQRYVLFGASTGDFILGHSLSTVECLELLLRVKSRYPSSHFVGYATDYDVNMILKDVGPDFLRQLWEEGHTIWGGYRFRYYPHKMFAVSKRGYQAAILFDVFTFFGTSFVKAITEYDIGTREEREFIHAGKLRRNDFRDTDISGYIQPYWEAELRSLVTLCETLRRLLSTAGIHLAKWHGPGAVASALCTRHSIKPHIRRDRPSNLVEAARNAYAGGRFEPFAIGRYVGEIYQYDIRSAYPHVLRLLPSFLGSRWEEVPSYPEDIHDWSLFHCIYYSAPNSARFGIPHWRYPSGNVAYPLTGESTWVYGVTLRAMLRQGWRVDIDKYLRLYPGSGPAPFKFIESLYQARQTWKSQGNQAQWAAKLGMNSVYGKLAQTVGEGGKIPPFHCLEWAGMITAYCRAQIAEACYLSPDTVIAVETDSVFSTVPLPLPLSDGLGDWELSIHEEIIYLQSGLYWLDGAAGKAKTRGVSAGLLPYEQVVSWLRNPDDVVLTVPWRRFHGMGTGLSNGLWRHWMDDSKTLNPLGLGGKRFHDPNRCPACKEGATFFEALHPLQINPTAGKGPSKSHDLPWLVDNE